MEQRRFYIALYFAIIRNHLTMKKKANKRREIIAVLEIRLFAQKLLQCI